MSQRAIKERPILFSGPMVAALFWGTKTQTRRLMKPQPALVGDNQWHIPGTPEEFLLPADRIGAFAPGYVRIKVGDRLWVREAHAIVGTTDPGWTLYRANGYEAECIRHGFTRPWPEESTVRWRPSIHMPRRASRLTLTVTDVRVEQLQQISKADAIAEGLIQLPASRRWVAGKGDQYFGFAHADPRVVYGWLWNRINGEGAWEANPWVAAYTFTVAPHNIDAEAEA